MHQIQIRVLAFEDIQQAVDYYEEKTAHITDKFLEHLYLEINVIQENPELFQKKYLDTRVRYIKGFPYGIHYILREQTIIILAVLHTNRNPNIGGKR
jgi:plasmid stabilization system protein ParE